MTTALHGFTATERARLESLWLRVRHVYPDPEHRHLDYHTASWLAFWEFLQLPEMLAVRNRSEWAGELVDVTFAVNEQHGPPRYLNATLRDCLIVNGLTLEQALQNLDYAARNYLNSLEGKPKGPHSRHQITILRRYIQQRREVCRCDREPCECERDDPTRIAH